MIHWLGAGGFSGPGIKRLAQLGRPLTLWNRTIESAFEVVEGLRGESPEDRAKDLELEIRKFTLDEFPRALKREDIVVCMLPVPFHDEIAQICLSSRAHLVTTGPITERMKVYGQEAEEKSLCFIAECGLDPGLSHLFTRELLSRYRESAVFSPNAEVSYRSYCGGFPAQPEAERGFYAFNWSPYEVMIKMRRDSLQREEGRTHRFSSPWRQAKEVVLGQERFEALPVGQAPSLAKKCDFDSTWDLKTLTRSTLRPLGWKQAWAGYLSELDNLPSSKVRDFAASLAERFPYRDGESDRVVLHVELEAKSYAGTFHEAIRLDESRNEEGMAISRLVSFPVTLAAQTILTGDVPPGVHGTPREMSVVRKWLRRLEEEGVRVSHFVL